MRKNNAISKFTARYFSPGIDLRVQSFNLLGLAGMAAGIIIALSSVMTGAGAVNVISNLAVSALAFLLLHLTGKKRISYRAGAWAVVIVVFLVAFPAMFFTAGGYKSGMPCFFVFAIIYTAIMLEKRERAAALVLELVLYAACVLIAYYRPETVMPFQSEIYYVLDIMTGIAVSSVLLLLVFLLHIRMYNDRQQRLVELDKLKSEFYQNMHHEMKTPLTVIISYINVVEAMIEYDKMDKARMREKITGAQREIISLARLLENTIDLASAEVARHYMEPIDFAALLRKSAGVFRAKMASEGNALTLHIPDKLPPVLGNADLLRRVVYNLVDNAIKHTQNGEITVTLGQQGAFLEACIRDTGEGIDPETLPHVWERGVTSNGTGYGLSITKTIVEEIHGGEIRIESEPGKGTAVTFSLPISAANGRGEIR